MNVRKHKLAYRFVKTTLRIALLGGAVSLPLTPFNQHVSFAYARIDIQPPAPRFVYRAAEDLRTELGLQNSGNNSTVVIRAGVSKEAVVLGADGFDLLIVPSGARVSAATWQGVQYGLLEMAMQLAKSQDGKSLPTNLHIREHPRYALRGVYAHTAWVYNYPFALRRWRLNDWKHYVDLLAYMRVNLLQIWNLVSILPQPLSQADRQYLSMFNDVVRYAKEERGFRQVWLGDAANDIALPSLEPIDKRQFYVVHALRNPEDPAQLRDIVRSRTTLYRVDPDADGYWVIDSDPGGWRNSPSRDFFHILVENRKLIDRYATQGRPAELIYWIWQGWGTGPKNQNISEVLNGLQTMRENAFGLLACYPEDLQIVAKYHMIPQTVWFPYGAVEGEPSSPYTALRFDAIRKSFEAASEYQKLRGVMANAQTPLVQIPNLWFFERSAWSSEYLEIQKTEVLEDLASRIYPRSADLLARSWSLLSQADSEAAKQVAAALENAVRDGQLDASGPMARYLGPTDSWLASNLAMQLRVHAAAEELMQSLKTGAPAKTMEDAVRGYFHAALVMMETDGFRPALDKEGKNLLPFFNWFYQNEDWAAIRKLWAQYKNANPNSAAQVYNTLKSAQTPECRSCGEMVEFLVGNPPRRPSDFKYAN